MREQVIDFQDVQGLVRGYGKSLPCGRFLLLTIRDPDRFRDFLAELGPPTSMQPWRLNQAPRSVTNLAFTFAGLTALGLPSGLLGSFPEDFRQGMKARKITNGDVIDSDPERWEASWRDNRVHVWLGVYAVDDVELKKRVAQITSLDPANSAFTIAGEQPVNVVPAPPDPTTGYPEAALIEHFGFVDGISNPAVEGISRPGDYAGTKLSQKHDRASWLPLAPGEFLLGHYKDEADERPPAPAALELATNSTFMVYRKLRQNVPGFWSDIKAKAAAAKIERIALAEHMVGRSMSGAALIQDAGSANDFRYHADPQGGQCPLGAHVRRVNPRDQLGFGTVLVDRHRLLRRGIPYGTPIERLPEKARGDAPWNAEDHDERGLIFIVLNASISRQFEFVQRRWVNDGDAFHLSRERDPIAGNHVEPTHFRLSARASGMGPEQRVTICPDVRHFVTTRGGDYFFLPGLGAMRYLLEGSYHV